MSHHKSIAEQVIVITGGTSGIGLATVRAAARQGASVVFAARNGVAVAQVEAELAQNGAQVRGIVADVSRPEDVTRIAEAAMSAFGRIDSWVNCAAVAVYGGLEQVSVADHRRLFDVNYWVVVYCSLEAVRRLRRHGGALVTIGSILGELPLPLQGPYVAAKHAVKGFTETLRMELDRARAPISVTLIHPSSIDTPYVEHAKTYFDWAPITPRPRYAPEVVADAILHACLTGKRTIVVGASGIAALALRRIAPAVYDWGARELMVAGQQTTRPASADADRRDNLVSPKADGALRSRTAGGQARRRSLTTTLQLHPAAPLVAGAALGLAALWALRRRR